MTVQDKGKLSNGEADRNERNDRYDKTECKDGEKGHRLKW